MSSSLASATLTDFIPKAKDLGCFYIVQKREFSTYR